MNSTKLDLKSTVRDVTLYWFVVCYWRFGGACYLYLQGSPSKCCVTIPRPGAAGCSETSV